MNRAALTIVAAILCCALGRSQTATGGIQGKAADDTGMPLPHAVAVATRTSGGGAYSAVAGSHGEYQIAGLPPGSYTICFQGPAPEYLNPCHWSAPPIVVVKAGAVADAGTAALQRGAHLVVKINDAGQRLAGAPGRPAPDLLVSVTTPRLSVRELAVASSNAAGRQLEIYLPPGVPLHLTVVSARLQISDAAGAPLPASARLPITLPAGATPATTVFNITGWR